MPFQKAAIRIAPKSFHERRDGRLQRGGPPREERCLPGLRRGRGLTGFGEGPAHPEGAHEDEEEGEEADEVLRLEIPVQDGVSGSLGLT